MPSGYYLILPIDCISDPLTIWTLYPDNNSAPVGILEETEPRGGEAVGQLPRQTTRNWQSWTVVQVTVTLEPTADPTWSCCLSHNGSETAPPRKPPAFQVEKLCAAP